MLPIHYTIYSILFLQNDPPFFSQFEFMEQLPFGSYHPVKKALRLCHPDGGQLTISSSTYLFASAL